MDKNIITECYVDTCLVETLVVTKVDCNHQYGCNDVANVMRKGVLKDSFALGIVDKDKRSLKYLEEFELKKQFNNKLYLYKHKAKAHYIIQIAPAVERFMMDAAQDSGLSLANYNLPNTLKELINETKDHIKTKKDKRLQQLFKDLKQRGSENICKLAQWVEHLKTNPYNPQFDLL